MSNVKSQIRAISGELHCRSALLYKNALKTIAMLPSGSMPAQVHAYLMGWTALGRKAVEGIEFPEHTSGFFGANAGAISYRGEESQHIIMNHTRGRTRYCHDTPSDSNEIGDRCMRPTHACSGYKRGFHTGKELQAKTQETVVVCWKIAISLCSKKRWTADDDPWKRADIATPEWSLWTTQPLSRECLKWRWHNGLLRKRHINSSQS